MSKQPLSMTVFLLNLSAIHVSVGQILKLDTVEQLEILPIRGTKVEGALNKNPDGDLDLWRGCKAPTVDASGNLYFSEPNFTNIFKLTPSGIGTRYQAYTEYCLG